MLTRAWMANPRGDGMRSWARPRSASVSPAARPGQERLAVEVAAPEGRGGRRLAAGVRLLEVVRAPDDPHAAPAPSTNRFHHEGGAVAQGAEEVSRLREAGGPAGAGEDGHP